MLESFFGHNFIARSRLIDSSQHRKLHSTLILSARAQNALAIQRLLEDHLYWVGMYSRWQYTDGNWQINKQAIFVMPPVIQYIAALVYRRFIISKQIHGHGFGRHNTDEIFDLGKSDLDAIQELLGENPIFLSDKPTSVDASAFGFMVNTLCCPIESSLNEHGRYYPHSG